MIRIEFLLAYVRSRAMDMMTTMQSMCSSLGLGAIGVLANLYVLSLVSRGRSVSGDRALRGHHHDVRRRADEFRYVVDRIRLAKASRDRPLGHAAEARHG